jgi:hypothetical protein
MLKYVSKFTMDILPSVVATIIGAYIVNHYIVTRPAADAPVAAAVSPGVPKKAETGNDAKPATKSADIRNIPGPGVKAKGISERAMIEQTAAERPTVVEKAVEKPVEKSADAPAETASIPMEPRHYQPGPREKEKTVAKSVAAPVAPAAPTAAAAPVVAAPTTVPPVEAAVAPEEHRDANELARAAIERLRGVGDGSPRAQEGARVPDGPRVAAAPVVSAPPIRPLPPPIMVSTPAAGTSNPASESSGMRPYPAGAEMDDPNRPTPPADIPEASPPLDLRAEVAVPPRREHTTVAEDMLLAAKSVFHAVLPK